MIYKFKGDKFFDYKNPKDVDKIKSKFHKYSIYLIDESNYISVNKRLKNLIPKPKETFNELFYRQYLEKIKLGIGFEFLLKALFLKNGYIIHKVNGSSEPKKINTLKETDIVHYTHTISFENLKNKISFIVPNDSKKHKTTLSLIQNWRNGLIHQINGPRSENNAQWIDIQNTFAELHNMLIENTSN